MNTLRRDVVKLENSVESSQVITYFVTYLLSISFHLKEKKISNGNDSVMGRHQSFCHWRHWETPVSIRQMRESTNFVDNVNTSTHVLSEHHSEIWSVSASYMQDEKFSPLTSGRSSLESHSCMANYIKRCFFQLRSKKLLEFQLCINENILLNISHKNVMLGIHRLQWM